jgi:nitrite reductase/ring-hydroxylating ferredoxin subunit
MTWTKVLDVSQLPDGERRVVDVAGSSLLVVRHKGKLCVVDSRCPHMGFHSRVSG